MNRTALHLAFLASGAAALVYEVLWMRRLAVLLGATAPAAAATLSGLFLGMAIGSALFGAMGARAKRPLLWFAAIEAGIAAAALGVEPLLRRLEILLTPLTATGPALPLPARMALAIAAILPPAILMGGSLPMLAQAIDSGRPGLGRLGGGLYAVNTLGAAIGGLAVPIALLPWLGADGGVRVAAAVNLGVAALALARGAAAPAGVAEPRAPSGPRVASAPRVASERPAEGFSGGGLAAAAFLSGSVALALEVLWTRMLALVHENSVYSFAVVITVCLTGFAAGAAAARLLLARGAGPRAIAGFGWITAGLWVIATPRLFDFLTSGLRYAGGSRGLLRHELEIAGLALAMVLPAAIAAGAVLPALMEMAGGVPQRPAAASLGALLAANTTGSIAGPLLVLFLAGPTLGLWRGTVLCGLVMLLAGGLALPRRAAGALQRGGRAALRPAGGRLVWYAAGAAVLLALRPDTVARVRIEPGERLVDLREGPFGTVAVVGHDGDQRLMLNNYYVLGGTASAGEERLQAHLPLLLHPAPRRVAFLGLGTGITAGAALRHPVSAVVAMELVPEAVAAARDHFRAANGGLFDDPRVRVLKEDARTGLRASPGAFDVIVGDLVVPWRRGEASLYTLESFASARRALAEGGIFCQWVPLFQLSRREFDSIAAAFLDVFPKTLLLRGDFRAGEPAVALVGLTTAEPLDPEAIDAVVRRFARDPDPGNPYLSDPAGLWVYLAGALPASDPTLREAPRNRDDRPLVELSSPFAPFTGGAGDHSPFVAERLKPYLDALLDAPIAGTPLERLDADRLRWRRAGADIWNASLLDLRGRRAEADALGLEAIARLPDALQRALGRPRAPPGAATP